MAVKITVRKRFVVNGTPYDDLDAMPPDVRQLYERAMRAVGTGGPSVTTNEVKLSFQRNGPKSSSGGSGASEAGRPGMTPSPIEPTSGVGGLRIGLIAGGCAAITLVLWLLSRAR